MKLGASLLHAEIVMRLGCFFTFTMEPRFYASFNILSQPRRRGWVAPGAYTYGIR